MQHFCKCFQTYETASAVSSFNTDETSYSIKWGHFLNAYWQFVLFLNRHSNVHECQLSSLKQEAYTSCCYIHTPCLQPNEQYSTIRFVYWHVSIILMKSYFLSPSLSIDITPSDNNHLPTIIWGNSGVHVDSYRVLVAHWPLSNSWYIK